MTEALPDARALARAIEQGRIGFQPYRTETDGPVNLVPAMEMGDPDALAQFAGSLQVVPVGCPGGLKPPKVTWERGGYGDPPAVVMIWPTTGEGLDQMLALDIDDTATVNWATSVIEKALLDGFKRAGVGDPNI